MSTFARATHGTIHNIVTIVTAMYEDLHEDHDDNEHETWQRRYARPFNGGKHSRKWNQDTGDDGQEYDDNDHHWEGKSNHTVDKHEGNEHEWNNHFDEELTNETEEESDFGSKSDSESESESIYNSGDEDSTPGSPENGDGVDN